MSKFQAFNEEELPENETPVLGLGVRGLITLLAGMRTMWGTGTFMRAGREGDDEMYYRNVKDYHVNRPGEVYIEIKESEWKPPLSNMLSLLIRERFNVEKERFDDETIWVHQRPNGGVFATKVGYVVDVRSERSSNTVTFVWRPL